MTRATSSSAKEQKSKRKYVLRIAAINTQDPNASAVANEEDVSAGKHYSPVSALADIISKRNTSRTHKIVAASASTCIYRYIGGIREMDILRELNQNEGYESDDDGMATDDEEHSLPGIKNSKGHMRVGHVRAAKRPRSKNKCPDVLLRATCMGVLVGNSVYTAKDNTPLEFTKFDFYTIFPYLPHNVLFCDENDLRRVAEGLLAFCLHSYSLINYTIGLSYLHSKNIVSSLFPQIYEHYL